MHIVIGYGWYPNNPFNYLEQAFRQLGHTVTFIGLPNAQRNGYDSAIPVGEIMAALPERADLFFYIDSVGRYFPVGIEDLAIPTACYMVDTHLGHWRQQAARFFDGVFVAEREYVELYRQVVGHQQVYWLPLSIAPEVYHLLNLARVYQVGFVGNIARAHRQTARARQLKLIADRFQTNDFYRQYSQAEINQIYNQAKIVFNPSISGGITLRILEGMACGALVLTDTRPEAIGDLFQFNRDMVAYGDDNDLLEKIAYYLNHEEERERIAESGCRRVQAEHTYTRRAQTVAEIVSAPSFKPAGLLRRASQAERFAVRRKVYTHMHMLDALLDAARSAGYSPWRRLWAALPCLIRRVLI